MKTPIEQYVIDKVREKDWRRKCPRLLWHIVWEFPGDLSGMLKIPTNGQNTILTISTNYLSFLIVLFPTFSLLPLSLLQKNFKH